MSRTKQLKDFPQLFNAFNEIELDNRGVKAVPLDTSAPITERWLAAFEAAERVLRMARKAKLVDHAKLHKLYCEFYQPRATLYDLIVQNGDDSTQDALKALKVTRLEAWLVEHLLNEFFEGSLREELITKSDDKRKH